jgi:hypothetical protein
MVGDDGWAVPLGGAPDHHMQKTVRCLNVMLLEGTDSCPFSVAPTHGSSRDQGSQAT